MASEKKIVLVTGANTGLGYEIVKALYESPVAYEIVLGCRTPSNGEAAIASLQSTLPSSASTLSVVQVDLESDASLEAAAAALAARTGGRLDVLVNNAGGTAGAGPATPRAVLNRTWDVNVAGPHALTTQLAPLLVAAPDPRLLFVTSGTSALAETVRADTPPLARINASPAAGWPKAAAGGLGDADADALAAYRAAKTGLNMVMRDWARVLRADGVKVWAVSPGFLATGLGGVGADKLKAIGALDPAIGGRFVRDVIEGKRDQDAGLVIRADSVQPW
ncbi:NAD(P)-binding protein [Durotheca rogersii]|uniref:NAD(P)-binding protein n=1 Tax=Durotheca rogersii TaxID=419775 RepID=UPI00221EF610|nr:NAD(P)-binding protein [Durotheca rogersii]KAI5860993.1 NAD(P)-binding protein [Durotheca rogersii]